MSDKYVGFLSGGISAVLLQPLDVIETNVINERGNQLQSTQVKYMNIFNRIQKLGLINLYKGGISAMVRQSMGFGMYSVLLQEIGKFKYEQIPKLYTDMLNAAVSKSIAIIITCPFIILKTRQQMLNNSNNIRADVNLIFQYKQFFTGVKPVLFKQIIYSIIQYSYYSKMKQNRLGLFSQNIENFVFGYISGLLAVVISHPFEVIRSRMMVFSEKDLRLPLQNHPQNPYHYTNIFQAIDQIRNIDGFQGFFVGVLPRFLRQPFNSSLTWGIYEMISVCHNEKSKNH